MIEPSPLRPKKTPQRCGALPYHLNEAPDKQAERTLPQALTLAQGVLDQYQATGRGCSVVGIPAMIADMGGKRGKV